MKNKIRLYGTTVNTWEHEVERISGRDGKLFKVVQRYQVEIEYKEYLLDGLLVGGGTEDFSFERYKQDVVKRYIYTWNGKAYHKSGNKKFAYHGLCQFRKTERDEVREYLKRKYNAKLLQLR